jgi:large subunit ribosomal protein L9
MEVVLLEKVRNLGNIGEKVKIKPGYGRNYLMPYGKAIPATEKNLAEFESRRAELEKNAADGYQAAQARATTLAKLEVVIPVKVSEEGKLFGSVGMREIILALKALGHDINKKEISLPNGAIREIGTYDVSLLLHSDVTAAIKVKIIAEEKNV